MRNRFAPMVSVVACLSLATAVPQAAFAAGDAPVKVQDKGALTGATQVAVVAFNVGFIFESVDATAKTGGLMGAFGGTTKAESTLVGVTPEMMQQITDAAYRDFVGKLNAQGIAVIEPSIMAADPEFGKVKSTEAPTEIKIALEKGSKGQAVYYKPSALDRQLMISGDFVGSGMSSMGLNMKAGQNNYLVGAYAKAATVPAVDVVYLIDFSQQKRPGAFSFAGVRVNANLSVAPEFSKMTVIGANGKTNTVVFKQPISVEGDFIEQEDASSGTEKTTQAAANVAGGLAAVSGLGGLRFGKTRKFEFTAKPGNYEEGAAKAASLANEQLVGLLASQR